MSDLFKAVTGFSLGDGMISPDKVAPSKIERRLPERCDVCYTGDTDTKYEGIDVIVCNRCAARAANDIWGKGNPANYRQVLRIYKRAVKNVSKTEQARNILKYGPMPE